MSDKGSSRDIKKCSQQPDCPHGDSSSSVASSRSNRKVWKLKPAEASAAREPSVPEVAASPVAVVAVVANAAVEKPMALKSSSAEMVMKMAKLNQENFDLRLYCYNLKEKLKRHSALSVGNCTAKTPLELQSEIRGLKLSVERKATMLIKGSQALMQLKADLDAALDGRQQMSGALSQQESQIEQLTRDKANLFSAVSHLEQQLQSLRDQLLTNEARQIELEILVKRSECDIEALKAQLELSANHMDQLEIENDNLRYSGACASHLAEELHQLRVENLSLRRHLNSAIGMGSAQSECLKQENWCLLDQLHEMPNMQRNVHVYEKELKALRAELKIEQAKSEQLRCHYEGKLSRGQSKIDRPSKNVEPDDGLAHRLQQMNGCVNEQLLHIKSSASDLTCLLDSLLLEPPRIPLPEFIKLLETNVEDSEQACQILCTMRRICGECASQLGTLRGINADISRKLKPWEAEGLARLIADFDAQLRSLRSLTAAGAKKWLKADDDDAWNMAGASSSFSFCPAKPQSGGERRQRMPLGTTEEDPPLEKSVSSLALHSSIKKMIPILTIIERTVVGRLTELDGQLNGSTLSACQFYELFQYLLSDVQEISKSFSSVFDSAEMSSSDGALKSDRDVVVDLLRRLIDDCFERLDMLQEGACKLNEVRPMEVECISRVRSCSETELRLLRELLATKIKAWFNVGDTEAWQMVYIKKEVDPAKGYLPPPQKLTDMHDLSFP